MKKNDKQRELTAEEREELIRLRAENSMLKEKQAVLKAVYAKTREKIAEKEAARKEVKRRRSKKPVKRSK